MADVGHLMVEREEETRNSFSKISERAVFFVAPKVLTEKQLEEVDVFINDFLKHNNDGEGFNVYTLGFGNSCKVIEEKVNKSKAVYKIEKIKWEDAKKGKKPLFEAIRSAMKKSEIVFYIDDGLMCTEWLKNRITEECVEYRLRLVIKRLVNKGEEDIAFHMKRVGDLRERIEEAARSFHEDNRPILTNEAYDKLKYSLNELLKQFPQLGE